MKIYQRARDPDYFRVCAVNLTDTGEFEYTNFTGAQLFALWNQEWLSKSLDLTFLTGCLVLRGSEYEMRNQLRQALRGAPVKGCSRACHSFFANEVCRYLPVIVSDKTPRQVENQKRKEAKMIMQEITKPLKQQLGYEAKPPSRKIYPLSIAELEEMDIADECRSFLIMHVTAGKIDREHRLAIEMELQQLFPDDLALVTAAFDDFEKVEPFAAIATPEVNKINTVSITNDQGQWIRMEAYRFCQLVEEPDTPWELGELQAKRSTHFEMALAVGNEKAGVVQGMMTKDWRLLVKVADAETDAVTASAEFLLDMDFVTLLSVVLRRLRQDADIHCRWRETALTVAKQNLFAT